VRRISLEWHRPHPWTLARISQRTGVKIARLRDMTFESLQPRIGISNARPVQGCPQPFVPAKSECPLSLYLEMSSLDLCLRYFLDLDLASRDI